MRGVTSLFQTLIIDNKFLLTRLMRGVTCRKCKNTTKQKFLLTRLMRGVTQHEPCLYGWKDDFYSHASCEA